MSEEAKKQTEETPDKSKKQKSVYVYLVIMFAAAFLLLLLSYFMQQRTNEVAIGSLTQSITSIESLDESMNRLLGDNEELRQQVEFLEDKLDAANQEKDTLAASSKKYEEYTRLLTTLRQAEELAESGDLEGAQAVLDQWDLAHFTKVLAQYDAEQLERGGMTLSPAFEALEELLSE